MDKDGKLFLDAGSFVKALEYAGGKTATVIGIKGALVKGGRLT
ncbi:MAG: hypothetical protein ABWK04_01070 [Hydrogenobacter sp.]